jgi:hypothetical protein
MLGFHEKKSEPQFASATPAGRKIAAARRVTDAHFSA